tara:strand:+ start:137 stop:769 length:633 start_codon:yes stop_codon:yes gene_type:complete
MSILEEFPSQFPALKHEVKLIFFTQTFGCDTCLHAQQIVEELSCLSEKIKVETYDMVLDKKEAAEFGVGQAPAIVVVGVRGIIMRYFGVPAELEIESLRQAILLSAKKDVGLSERTQLVVSAITKPVDLKVFVTATCRLCPQVVNLASRLAAINSQIALSVIEATEFPELVHRYSVSGVPKTVFNGSIEVFGQQNEEEFVQKILSLDSAK